MELTMDPKHQYKTVNLDISEKNKYNFNLFHNITLTI